MGECVMDIGSDNRKVLAQYGKGLREANSSSKHKIIIDNEDDNLNRIIELVKNNEKISIDDQITYMKHKGITFNHIDEEAAKKLLSQNTYYYKVTAFRKNFSKNEQGKYENLDFKNLSDLAVIDMHLRYFIMKLTLDIEHSIKTQLINSITESSIDSHDIVNDYDKYQKKFFEKRIDENKDLTELEKEKKKDNYVNVVNNIMEDYSNPKSYDYDLYSKQIDNPSIWVLLELMTFGKLSSFVKFYVDERFHNSSYFMDAKTFIPFSKNIRNCAAHSRPILLYIDESFQFDDHKKPRYSNQKLTRFVKEKNNPNSIVYPRLSNMRIHDIVATLYLHDKYVQSTGIKQNRKREFKELLERCTREKDIYSENKYFSEIYGMIALLM